MKARQKGSNLIIEMAMQKPKVSASGKTLIVASSRGRWESGIVVDGKPVMILVNAYIDSDKSLHGKGDEKSETRARGKTKSAK